MKIKNKIIENGAKITRILILPIELITTDIGFTNKFIIVLIPISKDNSKGINIFSPSHNLKINGENIIIKIVNKDNKKDINNNNFNFIKIHL